MVTVWITVGMVVGMVVANVSGSLVVWPIVPVSVV